MLPKRERISNKGRIKGLLARKQYHFSSPLLKLIAEENHGSFPRWVVICSKRLGKATERNRIRRVLMAAIYNIRHKIDKKLDIVVIPRKSGFSSSWVENPLIQAVGKLYND